MRYEGLDLAALTSRLQVPRCLALEKVTSTLDIVHELAGEGAPDGTVVLADEQVQGRGRHSRRWHSPKGSGIWMGNLRRPSGRVEGGLVAIRAGLAVVRAVDALGVVAQLKWPNDVMVHDRKLAGLLCEARWRGQEVSWIAIGIGINVHGPLPPEIAPRAIALDEVLPGITRLAVLDALMPWLRKLSDAATLTEQECVEYARSDWLQGRQITAPVGGAVQGLDRDGALLVQTGEGLERIVGGGVVTA